MAMYISSKGECTAITPVRPPYFSDPELERFVEGRPAFLLLDDGTTLVYNDVYYEIGVERNEAATTACFECTSRKYMACWFCCASACPCHRAVTKGPSRRSRPECYNFVPVHDPLRDAG